MEKHKDDSLFCTRLRSASEYYSLSEEAQFPRTVITNLRTQIHRFKQTQSDERCSERDHTHTHTHSLVLRCRGLGGPVPVAPALRNTPFPKHQHEFNNQTVCVTIDVLSIISK